MVLPSIFSKRAFPTMPSSVNAISEACRPVCIGLRWNKHRNYQLLVTKGWKDYAGKNGFKYGLVVKFSVSVGDQSVMYAYEAKF
ncbi:hypothetical protein PIB30_031343 [Stylosanthes scabra]|uniref:TF-B3 domain-containing protein n=1 Tax=Stylosanthes scabra TaxID=79078 RepID=A0ABU6UB94_9FABA|nr:hypothetical protein [Stylosanthes scabra]